MTNTEIRPFRIEVPEASLHDLRDRLARTRLADDLPGTGGERGIPASRLRELVAYWSAKYDWRVAEAGINRHPQFITTVDGQDVHFLHVRSARPAAIPLLLLHGWPGTPADFLDMIGPLTEPGQADSPAFHLVIPSLPGHGFSGPVTEQGWNDGRIAAALAELMARLGYDRYGVHGGDHGAFIGPRIGRHDPEHVIGVHASSLVTFPTGDPADMAALTDAEKQRLGAMKRFQDGGSAYMQVYGTRPNTIGHLLTDSPAGQLGWIAEKYQEWAGQPVDQDKVLTTVSSYWFTGTAASAASLYYERFHDSAMFAPSPRGTVPTGVAVFATGDYAIRRFAEKTHNVTHWSEFRSGGHFPALEVPDLLTGDIREFFGPLAG